VFSNATGLPGKVGMLTAQSSAFFITPVTPCAYSGLAMSTASASSFAKVSSLPN
jgi:hypothetical protein